MGAFVACGAHLDPYPGLLEDERTDVTRHPLGLSVWRQADTRVRYPGSDGHRRPMVVLAGAPGRRKGRDADDLRGQARCRCSGWANEGIVRYPSGKSGVADGYGRCCSDDGPRLGGG